MSFSIKGTMYRIFPTEQVNENFTKRNFVLEVPGDYPQKILFQTIKERCDLLDSYTIGDEVTVHFDIQGKEFTKDNKTNFFNNLNAWKLEGNAAPKSNGKPMTKVAEVERNDMPWDSNEPPF
jgi:hypothetical protein